MPKILIGGELFDCQRRCRKANRQAVTGKEYVPIPFGTGIGNSTRQYAVYYEQPKQNRDLNHRYDVGKGLRDHAYRIFGRSRLSIGRAGAGMIDRLPEARRSFRIAYMQGQLFKNMAYLKEVCRFLFVGTNTVLCQKDTRGNDARSVVLTARHLFRTRLWCA